MLNQKIRSKLSLFASSLFMLFLFSNCQTQIKTSSDDPVDSINLSMTSLNTNAQIFQEPELDPLYAPVLKKWRRDANLYKDFIIIFNSTAVMMSPEMKNAYLIRYKKLQGNAAPLDNDLVVAEADLVFILASYTPNNNLMDIEDKKLWNLTLFYNGQWHTPDSIKRYWVRDSLLSYFPSGTGWSRSYVVLFKKAALYLKNKDDTQNEFIFSMRSGSLVSNFIWK